jgi:predicted porin
MFKKLALVAAMTAAFTSVAQAQSNITIYGRLNTSIERIDLDGETSTEVRNNASRIGFKGVEDIGNGLKAQFVIEHGFESDTGAQSQTAFWARESNVGLSGNFGTVRLGNFFVSEAYYATADYVSMHNHDTGLSSDAFYAFNFNLASGKMQNAIAYTSPVISGFRADAQITEDNDNAGGRRVALAGNYDAGPLHLGAGYEDFNDVKSFAIRGLYEMGAITLGGYIEQNSGDIAVDTGLGTVIVDAGRLNIRVSAMYTMGASEFHANYGNAGELDDIEDSGAQQYTLGYNYNLSKRTKVYGYYTSIQSDGAFGAGLYGFGVEDFSTLAVGIRHNF